MEAIRLENVTISGGNDGSGGKDTLAGALVGEIGAKKAEATASDDGAESVSGGTTLSDIRVSNVNITGCRMAAGLVGIVSSGESDKLGNMTKCAATDVNISDLPGTDDYNSTKNIRSCAAGIVVQIGQYTKVSNCTASSINITGAQYAGGFVRYVYSNSEIKDCTASDVEIVSKESVITQIDCFAGFVEDVCENNTITNCSATNVTLTSSSEEPWIGGFVRRAADSGNYVGCSAEDITINAKVIGTSRESYGTIGGFAANINYSVQVSDCHASDIKMNVEGHWMWAAGFVTEVQSYSNIESSSANNITISGTGEVQLAGGFAAIAHRASAVSGCAVKAAVISGDIIDEVGGFAAETQDNASFINCVADQVTIVAQGVGCAGGFVADIGNEEKNQNEIASNFTACTVTENSITVTATGYYNYIGGFAGYIEHPYTYKECSVSGTIATVADTRNNAGEFIAYEEGTMLQEEGTYTASVVITPEKIVEESTD
jgi:hypothetical protein